MSNRLESEIPSSIPEKNSLNSMEGIESEEFDIETMEGRVEAYYNKQMGGVEEAKGEMRELFGLSEDEANAAVTDGLLIYQNGGIEKSKQLLREFAAKGPGFGLTPELARDLQSAVARTAGKEYGPSSVILGGEIKKISDKKREGKTEIRSAQIIKRQREVIAFEKRCSKLAC